MNEEYLKEKLEMLEDLRSIKNSLHMKIYAGIKSYSIPQLIEEIENDTDFGKKQVLMSIRSKEVIKKILEK